MWESEEDFERDWWALADCSPEDKDEVFSKPTPPISDHLRNARAKVTARSIYDMDLELDEGEDNEDVEFCFKPSRGRNMDVHMRRPGGKYTTEELRKITASQIREVIYHFICV